MLRKILAGSTSISQPLRIRDTISTTGAGLSGLVFNTASLVAEYRRQGSSSWTAITLVTKTLGTWVSGGFVADTGLAGDYELDLPNAAVASGAKWVRVRVYGAANMLAWDDLIELDAVDYQQADLGFGAVVLNTAPTAGTWGEALWAGGKTIGRRNTAQAGGANTITLDAAASAVDNAYRGHHIVLTGGTGSGQAATITGYVGSTKVATVVRNGGGGGWSTTPDATTVFLILPQPLMNVGMWLGDTPNVLQSGRVDGYVGAYPGNTAQSGDAFARLGANGAGLTALGDSRIANLDAAITTRLAPTTAGRTLDVAATGEAGLDFDNVKQATGATTLTNIRIPAVTLTDTVTTLTNASGDSSGVTTLLSRLSAARAGYLDVLNGIVAAVQSGLATSANQTTILNRLGAWTGSGLNTILGAFRALAAKAVSLTPTDLSTGTTFDNTTDSQEALRDRGDVAWLTGAGGSAPTVVEIRQELDSNSTKLANLDAAITTRAATGAAMTLTSGERDAVAAALLDLAAGVETSLTVRQAFRGMAAALMGKADGAATATMHFRDMADSKNRLTATVDADGNRTAITRDLT